MSPGDVNRNQIDYIMIKDRFRNNIKHAKTYPGADVGSDHNPVVVKACFKIKNINRPRKIIRRDMEVFKSSEFKEKFAKEVTKNIREDEIEDPENEAEHIIIDNEWSSLKSSIQKAANKLIPNIKREGNKPWITDSILKLMEERKKYRNKPEYNGLDRRIRN